jgi:hypothetical protein
MTNILLILELSNRIKDFLHVYRLHANIIRTFQIVAWPAIAPYVALQNDRTAAAARPRYLRAGRAENPDGITSHAGGNMERPGIG